MSFDQKLKTIRGPSIVDFSANEVCAFLHGAVHGLKSNGHAILMDETFDSSKRLISARVYHYITCMACQRIQHGDHN